MNIAHAIAAVAHLGQSAALWILAGSGGDRYKWPITRIGWEKVLTEKTARIDIAYLLPTFSLLSSANHIASVTDYGKQVMRKKVNWVRWLEYGFSAGLMIFLIAILSGVNELRTLVALVLMNGALQFLGFLIEKRKAELAPLRELVYLMVIAWVIFAAMWSEIIIAFYTVITESTPPKIVYSVIWVMFSLFASFGLVQLLYITDKLTFKQYEYGFIGLSLTSKSLLAWLVYGGIVSGNQRFS